MSDDFSLALTGMTKVCRFRLNYLKRHRNMRDRFFTGAGCVSGKFWRWIYSTGVKLGPDCFQRLDVDISGGQIKPAGDFLLNGEKRDGTVAGVLVVAFRGRFGGAG